MSQSEALQALIAKWERRALALTSDREVMRDDRVKARVLRDCADGLAALLLREGPQELHAQCHDVVCSGNRAYPRGEKGHSCSCRSRDERHLAGLREGQPQETTIQRHLDYLRGAMCEALKLPKDAPDEDIIDHAGEQAEWLSNYETHMKAIAAAAGVRLNGSEQQWSDMAREVIAGLREGQEPPARCKTCQGLRWVMRSETRDYSNGLGAGGMWNQPCPDCVPADVREGPPAPHAHAGEAPAEDLDRRVRMQPRQVMAYRPTGTPVRAMPRPRFTADLESEGEAPATEPKPPCSMCGGPHPFDTVLPSEVWNAVIRAAGLPEYLCLACIVERFGAIDTSFNCELWGGPFSGLPLAIHFNSRRARHSQQLVAANTELRHRLSEAERACKGLKERLAASQAGTALQQADERLIALAEAYAADLDTAPSLRMLAAGYLRLAAHGAVPPEPARARLLALVDEFDRAFGDVVLYGRGPLLDITRQLRTYIDADGEAAAR